MVCLNCKSKVPDAAEFCVECGEALRRSSSDQQEAEREEVALMKNMSDSQRMVFQSRMSSERKSTTAGAVLAVFLGGLGVHRFYLGQVGLGVVYVLLCWTFIPAVFALLEAFVMPHRVRQYNSSKATALAAAVRAL